ncbi:hypothetical protein KXV40_001977 [Aspergillus fumigatus]|nr:hypothetical protein KXV40_001977 [Aspergillus fumigatus]
MEKESGARDGVRSFHRRLDYDKLRCVICPDRAASWRIEDTDIVLSDFASAVLVKNRRITPKSLVLYRSKEYDTYRNPSEPLSASAQLFFGAIGNIVTGLVTAPAGIVSNVITEFTGGLYHGITGLVIQPRDGLKSGGGKGLAKGVGKGIGGLVLKPVAGIWGLVGYPLGGLRRELLKSLGKEVERKIIRARILQGSEELEASSYVQRVEALKRWDRLQR